MTEQIDIDFDFRQDSKCGDPDTAVQNYMKLTSCYGVKNYQTEKNSSWKLKEIVMEDFF